MVIAIEPTAAGAHGAAFQCLDRALCLRRTARPAMLGVAGAMSGDDYLRRNRDYWNTRRPGTRQRASEAWTQEEPSWGIWGIPEREVGMLRGVAAGMDALEDGCGTGYVSAWMARRGARVVGLDNSPAQLATARRLRREHGCRHRAGARRRRATAVRRCELRLRHLGVRRRDLGRPSRLDPGGGAGAAAAAASWSSSPTRYC